MFFIQGSSRAELYVIGSSSALCCRLFEGFVVCWRVFCRELGFTSGLRFLLGVL